LDSELNFVANSITLYPTQSDRDAGTNAGPTSASGIIRFKNGATVQGVVMGGPEFARVNVGVVLFSDFTLAAGANTLDLGTSGQLAAISAKVDSKASQASVAAIPTNPVLATDTRLSNLDAAISTRGTLTAPQVRTELANELSRIDVAVSSRLSTSSYTAPANADIAAIKTKTDTLVNGPTVAQIEASTVLAKEATVSTRASQTSVNAIPTNAVPTAVQNATAVRTELAAELARVDVAMSTRLAAISYAAPANADIAAIKTKTDALTNGLTLAQIEGSAVLAKAVAVAAIPTNPVLATDTRLDKLDATVSSRLAATGYTAPANSDISAIKVKTDVLANADLSGLALESSLATKASQASVTALGEQVAKVAADVGDLQGLV
jgi:hypothetical protein